MSSKARELSITGLGVGISSAGVSIASTVATLNFVGTGNTFSYDASTKTADSTISPDTTASPGTTINYPIGSPSPFVLNSVHVTESITFDNTNADTVPANVVVEAYTMTVDDSVTLTIEEGKTVIPDAYNIFG